MFEFFHGSSAQLIYLLLFVFLLLCGLGFPMAEELVLLAGGVWVAAGVLDPVLMFLVTFLGVVVGDVFLFSLGKGLSSRLSRTPRLTEWFGTTLERGRPFFLRHGSTTVFLARFLPGLRAPTFLLAGTMQMSLWRFVVLDVLASLLFVPTLCLLGYLFADQWTMIAAWFLQTELAIGTLVLVAFLGWLGRRYWGKRKRNAPATPP